MFATSIKTDLDCADEALLRIEKVMEMTGKTRNQVYISMRKGEFPRPVKIGERASAWVRGEVQRWITDRIAKRDALSDGALA